MVFAGASAGRKPHTRKRVEAIIRALIGRNANVALVMVTVRPQAFSRAKVSWASQVAHGPETRPETTDVASARQRDTGLQMTAFVAQLIPRLYHARSVVETVVLEKVKLEVERAVLCIGRIRVVPLSQVNTDSRISKNVSLTSKS